jgi:uncharacterized protein (DUF1697 family)
VSTYAAFLRGMNVGGHRISNEELRAVFSGIGLAEVRTFRASGNVIFDAEEETLPALSTRIEDGLASALGYAVPTFLREASEVRSIAAQRPFEPALLTASAGKLQVALLAERPSAAARRTVLALAGEQDRLALSGQELYWLPGGGILDSGLDLKAIAAMLGAMTMRTKGTIELIAEKHLAG